MEAPQIQNPNNVLATSLQLTIIILKKYFLQSIVQQEVGLQKV